jgi:fused signal recognition particle receptor
VVQAASRTAPNPPRHHPRPRRRRQRPCRTSLQHAIPPDFPPSPQTAPRPLHPQVLAGSSPSPATPRTAPPAAVVTAQPPAPEPLPTAPATPAPSGSTPDPGSPRATASGPRIADTPTPRSGTPAAAVLPTGSGGADQFAACVEHLAREPTADVASCRKNGFSGCFPAPAW